MDSSHPDYLLYSQIRGGVQHLDARQGRAPDEASDRLAASLLPLAKENGLTRVDHVMLSDGRNRDVAPGENVFLVQGRPDDPSMLRAHMPTQIATQTPVAESMQRLESVNQALELQARQQQSIDAQRQQDRPQQESPRPGLF